MGASRSGILASRALPVRRDATPRSPPASSTWPTITIAGSLVGLAAGVVIGFMWLRGVDDVLPGLTFHFPTTVAISVAIAAVVLGGISLRGGEGTIIGVLIGSAIMRTIVNGIDMFRIGANWRPDENWKSIIIGAVILIAVVLDQVVHIVQARRRTRRAATAGMVP